jgi:hypothetical protein
MVRLLAAAGKPRRSNEALTVGGGPAPVRWLVGYGMPTPAR